MTYLEYPIHPRLEPFIKVIYSFHAEPGVEDIALWRILPDTCVEIVWHIESPYLTSFANGEKIIQPNSFVMAQMRQYVEIQPSGKTCFIAVRLTATGAHHFFSIPVSGFSSGQVPLAEVWGNLAFELDDKLHSPLSMAHKVGVIQRSLLLQLDRNGFYDWLVHYCLKTIYAQKGLISVGDLAEQTGVSTRQLLRRFDRCVGASPKEFCRVVKFLDACHRLRSGQYTLLTDVAYACDYVDQAHFIHDFREFSGLTPGEFLRAENVFF